MNNNNNIVNMTITRSLLAVVCIAVSVTSATPRATHPNKIVNTIENTVRPIAKSWEQIHFGFSKGFLNVDPQNPLYCFTDGIKSI